MATRMTGNRGATRERDCIRKRINRMMPGRNAVERAVLRELLSWMNGRSKRNNARTGGLGGRMKKCGKKKR